MSTPSGSARERPPAIPPDAKFGEGHPPQHARGHSDTLRSGGFREWVLPGVLFSATSLTTLVVGGMWAGQPYDVFHLPMLLSKPALLGAQLIAGAPFAAALLGILLAHELGHWFAARIHRVDCSPPFFLPFPSLLGTLGAVIRMRGRIPHRSALVDIAAAGPLAGFVVALPVSWWGIAHSRLGPIPEGQPMPASIVDIVQSVRRGDDALPVTGVLLEGSSLLHAALIRLIHGGLPEGHDVHLHPVALAAWFGLFVTALNLVPVGQLDGGHMLYALLGRSARNVGRAVVIALALLGMFAWAGWMLWAVLAAFVVKTSHPPTSDDRKPLSPARRVICWLCLLLFVVTFVPVPLRHL